MLALSELYLHLYGRDMNKKKYNNNIKKLQQHKFLIIFSLVFGVFGGAILFNATRADVGVSTTSTSSNVASASQCVNRVSNYSYKVPFGNAVWNQPVCGLPRHPQSANYAERFYKWSNFNDGSAIGQQRWGDLVVGIGLEIPANNWSRHVYYAKDATQQRQVFTVSFPSNLDGSQWNPTPSVAQPGHESNVPTTTIPWNPAWVTGDAGDSEIIILDEVNGKIYEIYGYKTEGNPVHVFSCGPGWASGKLCANTVVIGRDWSGNLVDYRTFEGPLPHRGVGLSGFATFTMPQEVLAGEIRHALGIAIPNTAFGAPCTNTQLGTSAEGRSCGTAVAPATKFEWGSPSIKTLPMANTDSLKGLYTLDKTIPEGMRFALDIDDSYIENWINSRPNLKANPRKAETARIFARAIRDYGFIIADTSGNGAGLQVAGSLDAKTKDLWRQAGLETTDDYNILEGLIKQEKLYVVDPPTVKCTDGSSSKYYCNWVTAKYQTTTTPPSTTRKTDFNNDGKVNGLDLSAVLTNWDPNNTKPDTSADVNIDGLVNGLDLSAVLSSWTG